MILSRCCIFSSLATFHPSFRLLLVHPDDWIRTIEPHGRPSMVVQSDNKDTERKRKSLEVEPRAKRLYVQDVEVTLLCQG